MHDVVIRNGLIVDGTGGEPVSPAASVLQLTHGHVVPACGVVVSAAIRAFWRKCSGNRPIRMTVRQSGRSTTRTPDGQH